MRFPLLAQTGVMESGGNIHHLRIDVIEDAQSKCLGNDSFYMFPLRNYRRSHADLRQY